MSFKISDNAISVAALGPDGKHIAFSPNNHRVFIAAVDPTKDCSAWPVVQQLDSAHNQPIAGIKWHAESNKIITCAHDRTAFVWSFDADSKTWVPSVVMLDAVMTKGCTDCCFMPSGDRIVIASAHQAIAVGKYSSRLLWWTCKFATPHPNGSVTCLAPHPTSDGVLVTGSTDSTLRFLCVDTSNKIPEGQPHFGDELQKFDVGAWVHAVTFLPAGDAVAACLHSSKVLILSGDAPGNFAITASVSATALPCCKIAALSDEVIIAAGFDFFPVKIAKKGEKSWKLVAEGKQAKVAAATLSGAAAARQMFQNEASTGQKAAVELPKTRHGNTITSVLPLLANKTFAFMTTAVDGRAECWKDGDLEATA